MPGEHYNPLRIVYGDDDQALCITREQVKDMMSCFDQATNHY